MRYLIAINFEPICSLHELEETTPCCVFKFCKSDKSCMYVHLSNFKFIFQATLSNSNPPKRQVAGISSLSPSGASDADSGASEIGVRSAGEVQAPVDVTDDDGEAVVEDEITDNDMNRNTSPSEEAYIHSMHRMELQVNDLQKQVGCLYELWIIMFPG